MRHTLNQDLNLFEGLPTSCMGLHGKQGGLTMKAHHIIAGFSDIKVQFIEMTRTLKSLQELQLWFTFEDNVLYAHDYFEHETSMALAILNPTGNAWTICLRKNSYGEELVDFLIGSTALEKLQKEFNDQYGSHGTFRRFHRS